MANKKKGFFNSLLSKFSSPKKFYKAGQFDAALPDRDMEARWSKANSRNVDASLSPEVRRRMRERARVEVANNAYAFGAAMSLANAVVGNGPRLLLNNAEFDKATNKLADRIENDFAKWSRRIRLGQKLRAMRFSKFQDGEAFCVLHTNRNIDTGVQLDISPIDCERVTSVGTVLALSEAVDPHNIDGVWIDDWGDPVKYYVLKNHPGANNMIGINAFVQTDEYKADKVLHWFRQNSSEQHRGMSEMAPALLLFGYLDRYTKSVLRASEVAADVSLVFQTDATDDDIDADSVPMTNPLAERQWSRGMVLTAPEGMVPIQIKPEQPTETYSDYVDELLGQIGSAIGLPKLIIKHSASGYNYASGRLDLQEFFRFLKIEQEDMIDRILNPIYRAFIKEWVILNNHPRVEQLEPNWYFDGFEHVDPQKEANAQATKLSCGATNLALEYGRAGRDWKIETRQRLIERKNIQDLEEEFGLQANESKPIIHESGKGLEKEDPTED